MVSKVDEFKTVVLALDDVEVASIINALRYTGNDDLACEIEEEVYGECGGCGCDDMPNAGGEMKCKVWREGSSHVSVFDKYEDAMAWMGFCDLASGECKMRYEVLK